MSENTRNVFIILENILHGAGFTDTNIDSLDIMTGGRENI